MMRGTPTAIYARVSSERQAEAHTVESQVAALRERVARDGLDLPDELQFIDEGYSGATLLRPALERLRDVVAVGAVDRLYVHSPDRLARKYAYQVLLVDEFQRAGVEVLFLNRELGHSPEDELLLQVQGMMAEYERAKIIERHRRGKRHAARAGSVNVLVAAPYGYRYIPKHDGGGQARYEILAEEARVVRQMFDWVGRERVTIGDVCRRLSRAGEPTRSGKAVWDRSVVWGMLRNPAYRGTAAFGKTRQGPPRPRLRAQRGRPLQPRRATAPVEMPREEWIPIPVPAIVEPEVFAAVQEQLRDNQRHARQYRRGAKYLLQGLVSCKGCGYAYYGKGISHKAAKGRPRDYAYYRCLGTDAYRFGGARVCRNTQVRTDLLDLAVWREVRGLLEHPDRLVEEYRRRLHPPAHARRHDLTAVDGQLVRLRQGLARLIDSYAEGLIEKREFEPRITYLRQRVTKLEEQAHQLADEAALHAELQLIIGRLEDFAAQVKDGLEEADWTSKRELIRALVKRVEVDHDQVHVVFRVDQRPGDPSPEKKVCNFVGGVSSPALANLTLDGLERVLAQHFASTKTLQRRTQVHLVRYADDFIITGRTPELLATEVKPVVEHFLRERGLALSSTKTRITHISQGFDFLGQTIRKYGGKFLTRPSPKSVKALLGKVRATIKAQPQARAGDVIQQLNPLIRGWANYHRHGASAQTFRKVDWHISRMLRHWARRRHPKKSAGWVGQQYFPSTGPQPRVFTGKRRNHAGDVQPIRLYRAQETEITRHLKIKGAANPYDPVWGPYFEERTRRLVRRDLPGEQRLLRLWLAQGGRCLVCGQPLLTQDSWHRHHLRRRADGGGEALANLVLLHPNCHRQVHHQGWHVTKPRPVTGALSKARAG